MGWFERRKQRQRQRQDAEAEAARLRGLTPDEMAEKVLASDLAELVPTRDRTKLAEQVAQLTDQERYILAMAVEGRSAYEIARYLFAPVQIVQTQLRRILEQHLGVAHGPAGDWLLRGRKRSEGY